MNFKKRCSCTDQQRILNTLFTCKIYAALLCYLTPLTREEKGKWIWYILHIIINNGVLYREEVIC